MIINKFRLDLKWFIFHYNKIDLDIKIILKSKKYVTLNAISSDLKVVMIHMMYVWSLNHTYACLIVKHMYENLFSWYEISGMLYLKS